MALEVSCPSCEKSYKVKADAAGKKFRCKACQTVVTVPESEPGEVDLLDVDPWESVDEDAPPPPPPPKRSKSAASGKAARKRSGDGIPVTIMVSIGICGLLIAFNLFSAITAFVSEGGSKGQAGGSLFRLLIDVTIIKGLLERSNRIRWNAILLDILGLATMPLCLGIIVFGNQMAANAADPGQRSYVILVIGGNILLWIVDLVMLTRPSAREYCNQ